MLIAEQLMLLLLDPERGELDVRRDATDPDRLAAAALLLDLAEQRNLVSSQRPCRVQSAISVRTSVARHRRRCARRGGPGLAAGLGARSHRDAHATDVARAARRPASARSSASSASPGVVAVGRVDISAALLAGAQRSVDGAAQRRATLAAARARTSAADRFRGPACGFSRCGRARARDRIAAGARSSSRRR